MNIGQRVLKAVRESENTGTIVDNYQGLTVSIEKHFLHLNVYFLYKHKALGLRFTGEETDDIILLATSICVRNTGFKENTKFLGEIS